MKLKRKRALEVPAKIRSFINSVTTAPLESIEIPLRNFTWEFDKGDFHHWVDLFNHFDSYFDKYIKPRKDLQLEDNFLECDPPFPKEAVLQILRVISIILENCSNKHFYSSYEHHLSLLLASTYADVVEACLKALSAFLKKTIGKYIIRDASLRSKLSAFAQGWGSKEEGLGLIACASQNGFDPNVYDFGSSLHFEFYAVSESSNVDVGTEPLSHGLKVIHLPDIDSIQESDLELLSKLTAENAVPLKLRFSLLTRVRFARSFSSLAARHQYICIRLYAFIVLVQACGDSDDLSSFFNMEPEFINELVSLLSHEDDIPEKIRILSLQSLIALCHDRSRQPSVLSAVTSGGHRGILSSLMQKTIDAVINYSSNSCIIFAEALLSLITVLVSSSSGCSAMREAGFIPTLLPLLKDTNTQHLHLVSAAVHVLEAFMDYSNPAAALFRDLGGLDDAISRLEVEVSHTATVALQASVGMDTSECCSSRGVSATAELENMQPLYTEALVAYHRRLLLKSLLRAISLGTYAPAAGARICGSEESLLPHCLCTIFRNAKDFGGGVFALAATVMSDLIHKDPTCFAVLEGAGLPSAFIGAISDGALCSAEAITCIPQCLDALCLNNRGLQLVKDHKALRCFVNIFTSRTYLRALTGDTSSSLSSGLDELMRHSSSLREPGVDMLIEILNNIVKLGSGLETSLSSIDIASCSAAVPMETSVEGGTSVSVEDTDPSIGGSSKQQPESVTDTSADLIAPLPEFVNNIAHLLETILQNSDTCRLFVEKKGIEAVLELFTSTGMPLTVSLGQSISLAFKNFSQLHSATLARAVCTFLKEHVKLAYEQLVILRGVQLAHFEASKRTEILRNLWSLEGLMALSNTLLKGSTTIVSELWTADLLKEIGRVYKEILWQVSLNCDLKVQTQIQEVDCENSDAGISHSSGREVDDNSNVTSSRYSNPISVRSGSNSRIAEREFLTVLRSSDGFGRRSRHGLARVRGGRVGRHLEALQIDPEVGASMADTTLRDIKKKSPAILVSEIVDKLSCTMRSFFMALVKGFSSLNRRRIESGSLNAVSKSVGSAIAKVFLDALGFSGYPDSSVVDIPLSVKCRYLGKVVDDMAALTFDNKRRSCCTSMVNNFYVHGTFKEILTTFEATSQLLWTLPCSVLAPSADHEKSSSEGGFSCSPWLLETLKSYCRLLDYFANPEVLLSQNSSSQTQLLVQPVAVGLSIGLFPVPRDPEVFVRMLQSQVLDVILPVWNHPMFSNCNLGFVTSIIYLLTHVYRGVGDSKQKRNTLTGSASQRLPRHPPPDEDTIATIVDMGFPRARAEEALRRVETNSVELAMEWLFSHNEDPVEDDDEMARALSLSLGSSSESSKSDGCEKSTGFLAEECQTKEPPVDDILSAMMKFHGHDSLAYPLADLLVTLCKRNKREDRVKIIPYLVQQLKLCPLDLNDSSPLPMVSHTLLLLLSEDGNTREIAANSGVGSVVIDILVNLKVRAVHECPQVVSKCISALLLILDNLLQSRPKLSTDGGDVTLEGSLPYSVEEQASSLLAGDLTEKHNDQPKEEKDSGIIFENILGKATGYLTIEESRKVLFISCDLMKQHSPSMVMQAVLQLCARLTKTFSLAMEFLDNGGLVALFGLPRGCFFPGYDTLASAIVRHLLEDPLTLQTAMELEIRQALSGSRYAGRMSVRTFLTSIASVISRDPGIFIKASAAVCQLERSGGRSFIVLLKEKEREKDKEKTKATSVEHGIPISEGGRAENRAQDGLGKCSKGHKRFPVNLTRVIDHLLEILLSCPFRGVQGSNTGYSSNMEVNDATTKIKGKTKVGEAVKVGPDRSLDKSAVLARVTFVLKLLSDILLMYVQAVSVILRRDLEIFQHKGLNQFDYSEPGGIIHHILHHLLPLPADKSAGPDDWREKLSEKASWFFVVLSGRSGEGRKRVISELVKAVSSFTKSEGHSSRGILLPDKKVLAFVDLIYSILLKNSSSSSIPCSGCSPDISKSMIEGGVVQCLSSILEVVDLDYPEAPKVVNLVLKSLESLTRAANEQVLKSDSGNKKKQVCVNGNSDSNMSMIRTTHVLESRTSADSAQVTDDAEGPGQHRPEATQNVDGHLATPHYPMEPDMRTEETATTTNPPVDVSVDYPREELVEDVMVLGTGPNQITFPVENRVDEMGDDDDMGDDGEDDEDDDDPDEEDEDIAEGGNGLMSLVDTEDLEDNDDAGLGDEYNDDMMDEYEDDFHENRVIEVRWREALDGLDQFQVHGQFGTGGGLIDVSAEPFEGVNVDDLFGMGGAFGFERRRQTSRNSLERSVNEGTGLRHPLLSRPSHQSDDAISHLNSGRELEPLSAWNIDVAHLYMFDTPVLPYDNTPADLFSNRLAAPQPLNEFSVGLESLHTSARRGPGDGRWTDDGQPQAGGQANAIAQAVEEQFMTFLSSNSPLNISVETQSQNNLVERRQVEPPLGDHYQFSTDGTEGEADHNQNGDGSRHPDCQTQTPEGVVDLQTADREAGAHPSSGDTSNLILEDSPNNDRETMEVGDDTNNDPEPLEISPCSLQAGMQCQTGDPDVAFVDASGSPSATPNEIGIISDPVLEHVVSVQDVADADMNEADRERGQNQIEPPSSVVNPAEPSPSLNISETQNANLTEEIAPNGDPSASNGIDPTFLEALPVNLRAEVLASQRVQSVPAPSYTPPTTEDIDPEFLAALPPDIQAEVLAQQRAQRIVQQTEGQPVDMDNASIIATFPSELREEVLLTSSEAVLSALPSPLLAEAQMLRDRAMSHYQARSLFGSRHRLHNRRNGLGLERQNMMDRGVGVHNAERSTSFTETLRLKEFEGEPLLDANALRGLIRLLHLSQPLGKGLLQRLLLNLCTHGHTRAILVYLLLETTKPETEGHSVSSGAMNSRRLYGCHSNVVHMPSRLSHGLPPIVLRRVLEILTYLATNHSAVADLLFYFDPSLLAECSRLYLPENINAKGKEKIFEGQDLSLPFWSSLKHDIPLILFLKFLNEPLFLRSIAHLEQVMNLLQVVVYTATSKLDSQRHSVDIATSSHNDQIKTQGEVEKKTSSESKQDDKTVPSSRNSSGSMGIYDTLVQLPKSDLHYLCRLLGHEGLSEKVYMLAGDVLKKLASVAAPLRNFFISELSDLAHSRGSSAVEELVTLRKTHMLGLSTGSMAGAAVLRVLQTLSSLALISFDSNNEVADKEHEEHAIMWKLNASLEPLWQELSECISTMETDLAPSSSSPSTTIVDHVQSSSSASPPLPPGTQRLLPFIEAFFVLCEKLQASNSGLQHDSANVTASEVTESVGSSVLSIPKWSPDPLKKVDWSVTFLRFSEKHRRLLNAFVRQNPSLLEKSLSVMLKSPRLIDFDNKNAYFRSKIRQQHDQHLSGPLRISVRRAYVLEDSYNQLRMRTTQDLRGRLNVHFQGEEGIDAGGLTREWYQLLSRVIFDKGALLFTTVGNNATFQPNPNSVYQTEHLSYFKFVGRVVAKALFDGQLLDVYFTRSFYKHILGVKVTYHDIEAVDPDYYKNLKWMLENDVSDILDLTFSMDADEEKHILYEKTEVTDYELKPGGRNIRVTEETKHEYVDLVADHILTNAIRPQINSFLEGFNELVPRELISLFNDKELELLISGLPEINLDDLVANTEYTGYTAASSAVHWFWEVVRGFGKEDMARLLQFVTGTSKVPLEGFKALQGISGPQRFQIHKAYGAPERLPSAHTCFNQLDLPDYTTKDQLQERLLLAIHEASEGFGFG